ncbi:hypothetical protein GOV13_04810 [Candidatus Pacearchaeota archaeon]|nr:hypothetical protein [Candidatus Pacearchaeota archaeon]
MKVKISSFLKERPNRFKPSEANELGLQRLYKINFSGEIHLADKKTNTNMILVKSGDLVISGINVEKGALAVYQGEEDILATIHYSSYEFDKSKININYFKWFLKSDSFRKILLEQTKGGIKTELKPKKFLPLEIDLPDLDSQEQILKKINSMKNEINELEQNVSCDENLLSKLKQSILSEAVSGKLVSQNPKDESAVELLKKIKREKEKLLREGKIKKGKELALIGDDEVPYELPRGWVWCRLGDILLFSEYGTSKKSQENINGIPVLSMGHIQNGKVLTNSSKCIHFDSEDLPKLFLQNEDILFNRTNSYELVGKSGIFLGENDSITFASYLIRLKSGINPYYLNLYLQTDIFRKTQINPEIIQQCGQANFNGTKLKNTLIPLPPLAEQKRIVEKISKLMKSCDELKTKINQNKINAERLMHAILREVFGE